MTRLLAVPLDASDVFLMTFMILQDSYMEPTRVGSDNFSRPSAPFKNPPSLFFLKSNFYFGSRFVILLYNIGRWSIFAPPPRLIPFNSFDLVWLLVSLTMSQTNCFKSGTGFNEVTPSRHYVYPSTESCDG